MSIVGETTGALGLLGKSWGWLRDRLDPARLQAQRLIEAFEAYGIARQQIPRLMPAGLPCPTRRDPGQRRYGQRLRGREGALER
jgi:hypothetical protein